jgi:hypothetical protein
MNDQNYNIIPIIPILWIAGLIALMVSAYMGYTFINNDILGIENGPGKNIFVVMALGLLCWFGAWLLNRTEEPEAVSASDN